MNTFKFNACENCPMDIVAARKLAKSWSKRRDFPVEIVSVTALQVVVAIDAPSNRIHNKSVQALAKILQRHLDRHHFALSRFVPTLEGGAA